MSSITIDYFRYRTPSPITGIPETLLDSTYLVFMLEGSLEYMVNGEPITVNAGEALCLPVGTRRERFDKDGSAKYYSFLIKGADPRDLTSIPTKFCYAGDREVMNCLYWIEKIYIARYYSADVQPNDRKSAILTELLINICANLSKATVKNPYVERITEYIRDNYKSKLTIDTISEHVHLNPSYCSTLFKDETGETIGSFIKNYRLELAKDELERGSTVKLTAESVGFTDQYNFSKWFSKNAGMSPSEYRAKYSIKRSGKD